MLRGFYLASNGILNQQRILNTVSNNMANVNTSGYKSDTTVGNTFKRELILLNGGRINKEGTFEYRYTEESKTSLEQGSFEYTQRPLDVAIQGPVYFNLESNEGDRLLTRNGQFLIDGDGYLSLEDGSRILGENGAVKVGTSDFSINNQGEIFVEGKFYDTLELTYIAENENIQKQGDNTFTLINGENGEVPNDLDFRIIQGAYERSNVDIAVEMTKSMVAQRSLESMAQALQMIDAINQKAVSELARL